MGLFGSDEFRQLVGDFLIECSENVLLSTSSFKDTGRNIQLWSVLVVSIGIGRLIDASRARKPIPTTSRPLAPTIR